MKRKFWKLSINMLMIMFFLTLGFLLGKMKYTSDLKREQVSQLGELVQQMADDLQIESQNIDGENAILECLYKIMCEENEGKD